MSKRPTGWRAWGLAHDARGPVLASPEFGRVNPALVYPERTARAVCVEHSHAPPKRSCGCGMYTASTVDGCRVWLPADQIAVVGRVSLLGKTLPGAPMPENVIVDSLRPTIDGALGLSSSPEHRSEAVRLKGRQFVHPRHEPHAAVLTERYGVQFVPAEWVAETARDVGDELIATAHRMQADPWGWLTGEQPCLCGETHWGERAAGLLLLNRERTHVVLQRRSRLVDQPGTWALIGGAVEPDESPRRAALREAQEEAGLRRRAVRVERTITPPRPGCGGWTYTYVVATTDWDGRDPVLPDSATDEADGAAWFPVAALDRLPLHPGLARDWPLIRGEMLS